MPENVNSTVIVDATWVLDPRVGDVSDILMRQGKGLLAFGTVDVVVDGTKRVAMELDIPAEMEALTAAVREAGLTIIENANKVTDNE